MTTFQSRPSIVSEAESFDNIDRIGEAFRLVPMFTIAGENRKSVLELTLQSIRLVEIKMRGKIPFVTALNDIRQTDTAGWVCFLNGLIPNESIDRCLTKQGDLPIWAFFRFEITTHF